MITPREFTVDDFLSRDSDVRAYNAVAEEALVGSDLIDNLILLRFVEPRAVLTVLKERYGMDFAWLNMDMTPPEFRAIADAHGVLIENGRSLVIYVPLDTTVDDATLHIDIPGKELVFRYIASCNYKMVTGKAPARILTKEVANLRPLLVLRRMILQAIQEAATDIHLWSGFDENKQPFHKVSFRQVADLVDAPFSIDLDMMRRIIQNAIGKLSACSAVDIDSNSGVVTRIKDLFRDGSCDLRVVARRLEAGYFFEAAIQTVNTTSLTIDQLGFPKEDADLIREFAKRRTGLNLVTGKMRSGKNTTIFAVLNEIVKDPISIIEYSNPIENHMPFKQIDYQGDIGFLTSLLKDAKKSDIDIAVLNEIPDSSVAFAVRDLVNSAVGVWTTTHINRVWHVPNKLREFFGADYKTILSQLNVVINHRMFKRWKCPNLQKRILNKEQGEFELFAYQAGVRQYYVPLDASQVTYSYQPLCEIMVITDSIRSALMNFDEIWKAEQMLELQMSQARGKLENKVAEYINQGLMSLDQLKNCR